MDTGLIHIVLSKHKNEYRDFENSYYKLLGLVEGTDWIIF